MLSDVELTELVRSMGEGLVRSIGLRYGEDVAQDAVAEAFYVAWRRRSEMPDAHPARRAWIKECARRTAMDMQRGLMRRRQGDHGCVGDRSEPAPGDPAEALVAADEVEWLLGQLRPSEADAVRLVAVEGMRGPEAASQLGITPLALRKRVSRATASLRAVLHAERAEHDGAIR